MRKTIIAGNWKMYKTPAEALTFLDAFLPAVASHTEREILLFPSDILLATVLKRVQRTPIAAGAQTMHWAREGAYTGQTSASMLTSIGVTHVLLGHSEQRAYQAETYELVHLKIKAAFAAGLKPVVCVGESLDERQAGVTEDALLSQLSAALVNLPAPKMADLTIAYEPIWAIGSGLTASPEQANEVHAIIRGQVKRLFNAEIADATRILYGGSVKPENSASLLAQPEIDGLLIGGASLDPESLATIVNG
jgi:triosephosphate isomerase (TIM)